MKDSLFTVTITKLSHEGRGIGRLNGKTQFIDNALPEEIVKAKSIKTHSKYDEAIAKEIILASPNRITPPCPHYLICGGCRLQHLEANAQILFKQDLLQEQLMHLGKASPKEWLQPVKAQSFGYRRKARFAVHYTAHTKKMSIGFKQMDGVHTVHLSSCAVLHEKLEQLFPHFSSFIGTLNNLQHITEISCAMGDEDIAVIVHHTKMLTPSDSEKLIAFAKQHQIDLYTQAGKDTLKKCYPDHTSSLLYYTLPNYQLKLAFQPNDFTQVNSEINALMIDKMIELLALQTNDQVLDLFCGMGNLSLPIARFAKQVWGVEGSPEMVQQAECNAKNNQLEENTHFVTANLKQPLELSKRFAANKVVLDPPRSGAIEILPAIVALKPERIVYISCNPATLARDTAYLTSNGYILTKAGVLDMFPQTQHVESITLFMRKN